MVENLSEATAKFYTNVGKKDPIQMAFRREQITSYEALQEDLHADDEAIRKGIKIGNVYRGIINRGGKEENFTVVGISEYKITVQNKNGEEFNIGLSSSIFKNPVESN